MPQFWKLPPVEKVPEAYSAVADSRVEFVSDHAANVKSSDGSKTYHVSWDSSGWSSDDNGSRWQGYSGYPILAVMILKEILPADCEVVNRYAGVDWTALNKQFKRDYAASSASVMEKIAASGFPKERIEASIAKTYEALKALKPARKGSGFSAAPAEKPPEAPVTPFVFERGTPDCSAGECAFALSDGKLAVTAGGKTGSVPEVRKFFESAAPKTGHDLKQTWRGLEDSGTEPADFVFDTALAAWLLDPSAGDYSLPKLAEKYLRKTLSGSSPEESSAVIAALRPVLAAELEKTGMTKILSEIELPLSPVLADMERAGIRVDREKLADFGKMLSGKIDSVTAEIYRIAGGEFNINSTKQLGELLFEKLKLESGRKNKSGYSTDIDVLEKLRDKHEIVGKVIEFRQLSKLKSTYADGLARAIAPDGRIHSCFNMTATATGRLSSAEPNLQNIPIRSELGASIREVFPASEHCQLVSADYSQIELRILAHVSGDERMRKAFADGMDIHTATASEVFGVPPESVTKEQRRRAKAVNFGIVYGISAFALSQDLEISRAEAEQYIQKYFDTYSGVKLWLAQTVAKAHRNGWVATMSGRRRPIPELRSNVFNVRSFGERAAKNTPIQGTAADIIKLAMIRVFRRIRRENLRARLILQIHDELIVDTPVSELDAVKSLLRGEMENAVKLSVPLPVEISCGATWKDA